MPARILIVDDYVEARMAVRSLLEEHSFEVCGEATNGEEAIQKVGEIRPDVVVLDINMPVMNGVEAASEIRRISPATKVVLLTMHDFPGLAGAMRPFANAFVSKASAARELIPTLAQLIEMPAAPIQQDNSRSMATADAHARYPWQSAVFDAIRERQAENLPSKISAAQLAISGRLIEADRLELSEEIALKEALQMLGKLLADKREAKQGSSEKEEIA